MANPGVNWMALEFRYRCFVCGRRGMTRREADEHWGDEFESIYLGDVPILTALNSTVGVDSFRRV